MSDSSVASRKQELAYIVAYSYFLERLSYRWYSRIDKLISFLLLLSGMAVVADVLNPLFSGLLVAFFSAWQLVYAPGAKSASSRLSMVEYANLLNHFSVIPEAEVTEKLNKLTNADTSAPGCLEKAANNAACIKLDVPPQYTELRISERLAAWFCG